VALTDHEFGGVSTNLKLSLVERYLSAFTTALQGKFKELWYIDAFAGTGKRTVRLTARDSDLFDAAKKNKSSAIVALRESQLKQCHRSTG
jgi:three-Cys-motif partner protein